MSEPRIASSAQPDAVGEVTLRSCASAAMQNPSFCFRTRSPERG